MGSHGSSSLPFVMKVMVCYFVSDSHEVMTALIVVLPIIVVVEISLQLHRSSILCMILCQSDSQAIGLPFARFGCLAKDDPAVASESLSDFSFICLGDRWS